MLGFFKDIDRSMLLKLVALHVIVIVVSNALVSIPVEIFGIKLTWAAFTFPLVVLATDLTVRMLGKNIARSTIAAAYPLAIIGSIAVGMIEGAPQSEAMRIGLASATAYAVGTMLDVYVFQWLRENFMKHWWIAPAVSTIAANIIDTYAFFYTAFYPAPWVGPVAFNNTLTKIVIGLIVFLPASGILFRYLNNKMQVAVAPVKAKAKAKAKAPAKKKVVKK